MEYPTLDTVTGLAMDKELWKLVLEQGRSRPFQFAVAFGGSLLLTIPFSHAHRLLIVGIVRA
jgi:hypothetical protein